MCSEHLIIYRISQLAKPQIKGRGFIGSGNEIIETQTYYTIPEQDWIFDEDMKVTYNNPVFQKQLDLQGRDINDLNTGWVAQIPLDRIDNQDVSEETENAEEDSVNEIESITELEMDSDQDDDIDLDEFDEISENNDIIEAPIISEIAKNDSINKPPIYKQSIRSKVTEALGDASLSKPNKPVIKLNIDRTTADAEFNTTHKPKIQLKTKQGD